MSVRLQVLQLAHQSGVCTRAHTNSKVWGPRMSSDPEHHVQHCRACAATPPLSHYQVPPPIPTRAATRLFLYVSTDLFGPLPSGEYLLAFADQFTRYPEVAILHSTSFCADSASTTAHRPPCGISQRRRRTPQSQHQQDHASSRFRGHWQVVSTRSMAAGLSSTPHPATKFPAELLFHVPPQHTLQNISHPQ